MASEPYRDKRRGTWLCKWFDGKRWVATRIGDPPPGWAPGKPLPAKAPPEVTKRAADLADRELAIRRGRAVPKLELTLHDFLWTYAARYEVTKRASSVAILRNTLRQFLPWCAEGGGRLRLVSQLTTPICDAWLEDRAKQGLSGNTLHLGKAMLSAAWNDAIRRGELDHNPWTRAISPKRRTKVKRPSWSPEEFAQLYAVSAPWLKDLLLMGTHTGIRISALLALEWDDVVWEESAKGFYGHIRVRPELDKAGKGYTVPIHKHVHDLLGRLFTRRPRGKHILAGQQGKKTTPMISGRAIRAACKRAGLEPPPGPNHAMRRTFGRWAVHGRLVEQHVPVHIVSRWMGHANVQMTEHYLDLRDDESAAAMGGETMPRVAIPELPAKSRTSRAAKAVFAPPVDSAAPATGPSESSA